VTRIGVGGAVLLITVLGCAARAADAQEAVIRVEEVASTKGNPAAYFGTIGDMLEVSPGLVAVADDVSERVHLWDVSTNSVRTLARAGDGPGEVRTPAQLARRPGGGFGVYDVGHAAVLLFDPARAFERKVVLGPVISNAKDFALLPDGSSVLAGGRIADPKQLQRYSSEGARLAEWGEPSPLLEDPHARVQAAGGARDPLLRRGFGVDATLRRRTTPRSFGRRSRLRCVRPHGGRPGGRKLPGSRDRRAHRGGVDGGGAGAAGSTRSLSEGSRPPEEPRQACFSSRCRRRFSIGISASS